MNSATVINSTRRRRMNYARTWLRPEPAVPQPRQVRNVTVVMHIWNEYFDALSEWQRRANVWACTRADKAIGWMVGMNRDKAKVELLKRGCNWERVEL